MALKEPLMVKNVVGANDLELRANVGESLLIKRIYVYSTTGEYVTVKIDKTTVGYFRVGQNFGGHLEFPKIYSTDGVYATCYRKNLLDLLSERGIFTGYPVAEGETFYITGINNAADRKCVVYEVYDAGDINPEMENGSKSKEYFIVNYGDTGSDISDPGDHLYTNSLLPVEFPSFPYGADVPAKTTITMYGILGKEVGVRNATPATAIYTTNLKLVREREVLFDQDRNGLLFDYRNVSGNAGIYLAGGHSVVGNFDQKDPRLPFFFPEPLEFTSGEELNIYVTTEEPVGGSNIPLYYQTIGLIEKIKRE